jgi:predicted transcriptional regulator of viral defense system
MTEKEGYDILSKPYITTKDVAKVLGISSNQASKVMTKKEVRKICKGSYITADFVKKFGLTDYLKRVSRFAEQ